MGLAVGANSWAPNKSAQRVNLKTIAKMQKEKARQHNTRDGKYFGI